MILYHIENKVLIAEEFPDNVESKLEGNEWRYFDRQGNEVKARRVYETDFEKDNLLSCFIFQYKGKQYIWNEYEQMYYLKNVQEKDCELFFKKEEGLKKEIIEQDEFLVVGAYSTNDKDTSIRKYIQIKDVSHINENASENLEKLSNWVENPIEVSNRENNLVLFKTPELQVGEITPEGKCIEVFRADGKSIMKADSNHWIEVTEGIPQMYTLFEEKE